MTESQRKAMQDALEALTKSVQFCNHMGTGDWQPTAMACHGGIAALRNALKEDNEVSFDKAEPAPEPDKEALQFLTDVVTAAGLLEHGKQSKALAGRISSGAFALRPRFAAPVREPAPGPLLTDEEISAEASRFWSEDGVDPIEFGRAIEALVRRTRG